ncbi:MAG: hypothetical protein A2042_02555 [Candidatus Schekmanbacteria bacterium GWA2_38_11]|uniref:DUF362 domain-containing protein n=1 Tax=Candidatus Schekmanbacteria bacterium GWA2_38_11 TaxID=1817876 RepID=A0A1F7RLT1_9BACT|nr:MAG: hypothetical protein A2042_02555 [Candidatus Schekmanbacteria bacterium GWA2_38_11]
MKINKPQSSRRKFLKKTFYTLSGTLALQLPFPFIKRVYAGDKNPRRGLGNLFLKNEKPLLIVMEGNDKMMMLKKGLEKIGNFEKLVKGKKVVLKPNTVSPGPYPVCTDPDFLIALGKSAIDAGAKSVSIFDSPGRSERIFRQLNLPEKAKQFGIELNPVEPTASKFFTTVENQAWEVMEKIDVAIPLKEADVVINVPTVKRHLEAGFSCAMKNHFGSVYGPNRFEAHVKLHKGGTYNEWDESFRIPFRKLAAEFSDTVRCELNVVDAQYLLTKSGPLLDGAEIKQGVNKLIISGDIVATDAYCSSLMAKHDPSYSLDIWEPVLKYGEKLGLGISDPKKIEIVEI